MKYVFLILLLAVATLAIVGCEVNPEKARRLLVAEGCTEIALQGHPMIACGEDDWYATAFTCVRNGQEVQGYVCGGPDKGYTVRYR